MNIRNICTSLCYSQIFAEFFSGMAESWEKLKDTTAFSLFLVCYNRNRSALVREVLRNSSLFFGCELGADKASVVSR